MVRAVLQRDGCDVDEAASGDQAIVRIREKRYSVVVLDIMMGGGSGHDVLTALATDRPHEKCVVVISATSQPEIDKIAIENVKVKLRKPFDISELVDAIRGCLSS